MKTHIFPLCYAGVLFFALLYPFDFDFNTNQVKWLDSGGGILFEEQGQIISPDSLPELHQILTQAGGLSLEVWLKTGNTTQDGPARILSYSIDPMQRNFTLGQSKDRLIMRLRTEYTDPNGIDPHLVVPAAFKAGQKTHVVVTYDFQEQCAYINGAVRSCQQMLKGDFSNWNDTFKLVIGNEASGARSWTGEIYYAAIYDRALDRKTIEDKFRGKAGYSTVKQKVVGQSFHPIVQYRFEEKKGRQVYDTGFAGLQANLHIPLRLPWAANFLKLSQLSQLKDLLFTSYSLVHALLFVPLGFYAHRYLSLHMSSLFKIVIIALIVGVLISFATEFLQHFLPSRTSSIIDVIANLIGVCFGMALHRYLFKRFQGCNFFPGRARS